MSKLVFLYVLRGGGYLKVGITRDLARRVASMNRGAVPFEVTLVGAALVHADVATKAEADVLAQLGRRARGEWVYEDQITVAQIVQTFAMCSSLLPSSYAYAFMPGATAALSNSMQRLAKSARSEQLARAARDVFSSKAARAREEPDEGSWQVSGKFARLMRPEGRQKLGPPTYRKWKKALQAKTMREIAKRRTPSQAAE